VLGIGYLLSVADPQPDRREPDRAAGDHAADHAAVRIRFPIDQMPRWSRTSPISSIARYYVTILKAIFLKGSGVPDLARRSWPPRLRRGS
jgi:ABC-2 type transport system permease protein